MDIIPDKRKLVGLVEQAYQGKLCLPNFQRSFVWPRDEVSDLLRSVIRRYFVGSLLLLRTDPHRPPFAPIFLRGANPEHREPRPELLVLDGQQRLTSLIYALTAPDLSLKGTSQRRWFFFDLGLFLKDSEDDEIVFDRAKRELDGLDKPEVQFERRILPCTRLLRSEDFYSWRDDLDDWLRDNRPEEHKQFREEWRDKWTKVVTDFQTFDIPLVELPRVEDSDSDAIGRVCAIFEKLNSTGVRLSVYDLLTARLYRSGIKLHDLWAESCKKHRRIAEWSDKKAENKKFGIMVLRTLALLRGLDPKPRILIDLKPDGFERDWRRAAAAMERALELVTLVGPDGFGVFDRKFLPGYGLIPVLAALRAHIDDNSMGEKPRADLRRWYWCNVFLERYSSAVESKSRKDYSELVNHWGNGGPEPSVFVEARARIGADGYSVRDSASYASAVYSGIFCLLALRGARDWRRGENIQLQQLHDHHIFPKAYLRRHGIRKRINVNTIVNRTLISDETNRKIRDDAPADYLSSADIFQSGPADALLSPHFCDQVTLDKMQAATEQLSDDQVSTTYEAFCRFRERQILQHIRESCGLDGITPNSPNLTPDHDQTTLESEDDSDFEEDDGESGEQTDRAHWDARVGRDIMAIVDGAFALVNEFSDHAYELKYLKWHIGIAEQGDRQNFLVLLPKRHYAHIRVRVDDPETWITRIEEVGLPVARGRKNFLRITVTPEQFEARRDALREVIHDALGEDTDDS